MQDALKKLKFKGNATFLPKHVLIVFSAVETEIVYHLLLFNQPGSLNHLLILWLKEASLHIHFYSIKIFLSVINI